MSESPSCPGDCKPRCATCKKAQALARQRAYLSNKAANNRLKAEEEAVSRGERVAYLGEDGTSSMPVDEGSWFEKPWPLTEHVSAQSRTGLIDALAEKMTVHVESPNQYLSDVLASSETVNAIRRQIKNRPLVFHGSYVENDDVPDPANKKEAVKQLAESIIRTFADDDNEEGQNSGFYRFRTMGTGHPEKETTNRITLYYGCCQDQKTFVPASSSSRRHSHHQSDTPRPSSPAPSSPAPSSPSSHPLPPPPSSPTPHLPSSTSLRLKPFRERSGRRGMDRFECQSHMSVSYNGRDRRFTVRIKHGIPHVTYQRADIPPEVDTYLRKALETNVGRKASARELLQAMVEDVSLEGDYSWLSEAQIRTRVSQIIEARFKFDPNSFKSAAMLLDHRQQSGDAVRLPLLGLPQGVSGLAFGLKGVLKLMEERKIVVEEISVDATFGINIENLELYAIVLDVEIGVPAFYMLLDTKRSLSEAARTNALRIFFREAQKATTCLNPKVIHTDKDWAEINAIRAEFLDGKPFLCLWHVVDAIATRLNKGELATRSYNSGLAHQQFPFIDPHFVSINNADPTSSIDSLRSRPSHTKKTNAAASMTPHPAPPAPPAPPPPSTSASSSSEAGPQPPTQGGTSISLAKDVGGVWRVRREDPELRVEGKDGPPAYLFHNFVYAKAFSRDLRASLRHAQTIRPQLKFDISDRTLKADLLKLFRVHIYPQRASILSDVYGITDPLAGQARSLEKFCPQDLRRNVIDLIKKAFHAHPDIPVYGGKTADEVYVDAVKAAYFFCHKNRLPALWAYLYANWYEPGRWELWARSAHIDFLPLRKTNMMVERHFGILKGSFFNVRRRLRLDAVVFKLVDEVGKHYVKKLREVGVRHGGRWTTGSLPWVRRDFWASIRRYKNLHSKGRITVPGPHKLNAEKLICSCRTYSTSPFFFCKHLFVVLDNDTRYTWDWLHFAANVPRRRSPPFLDITAPLHASAFPDMLRAAVEDEDEAREDDDPEEEEEEEEELIVGELYSFNSHGQMLNEGGVATKDQGAEDETDGEQGIWDEDPEVVGIEDAYARECLDNEVTEARARLTETASMLRRLGDLVESQADGGDVELSKTLEKGVTGSASLLWSLEGMLKKKRKGEQTTQRKQRGMKVARFDAQKALEWLDTRRIDESGDESD
ncbi:hypothetical protein B9479_002965 [Cryptococcus floricola]|uniref:SWIM-type domain-containing protein n=1 Tax=Cryptococcus floricola TaxID=2591691 RepID=A0A5D3AZQ0_9TREE|nr:hypothetical protein B9479_002965 [Cryptococcus floricola]